MDQVLRDKGINPYSVEGLRMKRDQWMFYARASQGWNRSECVKSAREANRRAVELANIYRQYPEFLDI